MAHVVASHVFSGLIELAAGVALIGWSQRTTPAETLYAESQRDGVIPVALQLLGVRIGVEGASRFVGNVAEPAVLTFWSETTYPSWTIFWNTWQYRLSGAFTAVAAIVLGTYLCVKPLALARRLADWRTPPRDA